MSREGDGKLLTAWASPAFAEAVQREAARAGLSKSGFVRESLAKRMDDVDRLAENLSPEARKRVKEMSGLDVGDLRKAAASAQRRRCMVCEFEGTEEEVKKHQAGTNPQHAGHAPAGGVRL